MISNRALAQRCVISFSQVVNVQGGIHLALPLSVRYLVLGQFKILRYVFSPMDIFIACCHSKKKVTHIMFGDVLVIC